jgi:hypothetical protein
MVNPIRIVSMQVHPEVAGWWCAGMPEHWYLAIRLKWAKDISGVGVIEIKLLAAARRMAQREKWRLPEGKDYLPRMVKLAVVELADPARFAKAECWRLRAAYVDVGSSPWYRTWRKRYEAIFQELNEWSNRGFRYIRVKQQREVSPLV